MATHMQGGRIHRIVAGREGGPLHLHCNVWNILMKFVVAYYRGLLQKEWMQQRVAAG